MYYNHVGLQKFKGFPDVVLIHHSKLEPGAAPLRDVVDHDSCLAFDTDAVNIGASIAGKIDKDIGCIIERACILSNFS